MHRMMTPDSCVKAVRQLDGAVVISLAGEIDLHHTPDMSQVLSDVCLDEPALLVVNLEDVTYMDSSAIGALVQTYRQVRAYEGRLRLCGMSERVLAVFEITKLDKFFDIYPSEAEALAA
jgi:anti-anti-sigma factor